MHETLYSVTSGVSTITTGVMGATLNIITDLFLLVILGAGLIIVDAVTAFSIIFLFSTLAYVMYVLLHKRAERLGRQSAEMTVESNQIIFEILVAFREAVVRNRRSFYADKIGSQRVMLANISAEFAFLPSISKYVLEIALIVSAMVMGILQFTLNDTSRALATLVLFFAGSYRIAPAILRVQQSIVTIRTNIGMAKPTLDLISNLSDTEVQQLSESSTDFVHKGFDGKMRLSEVCFRYPESPNLTLRNIDLEIKPGTFVAIVGPSGAGKSTLADICLGVLEPDSGKVELAQLRPIDAISKWPGAIAYVPQDVVIFNTSVKSNVTIGFNEDEVDKGRLWRSLESAQLKEFVLGLSNQENTMVGDRGTKLSGGQRQRLGIARALYTNPKLLILDEATSALDGITESNVTDSILALRGQVTLVVIAHRLSTVRAADKIIYLSHGSIIATGSFQEVRAKVPDFDEQANLMGLD
jgi:ABC-type bacteriocin/lantibiotic exporter with double-glycine peptidase domain